MSFSAQIESAGLARIANNALAHFPANSNVKAARVRVSAAGIEITATDSYTAGKDHWPWYDAISGEPVAFEVNRETLQQWDTLGRKDKKGVGRFEYQADGVIYHPQEQELGNWVYPFPPEGPITEPGMWAAIDQMLGDVLDEDIKTAFQPELLQRFSKVKADKTERVADLAISDPDRPVLIKIGPTFKGLIMPVYREKHAELVGDSEGLW